MRGKVFSEVRAPPAPPKSLEVEELEFEMTSQASLDRGVRRSLLLFLTVFAVAVGAFATLVIYTSASGPSEDEYIPGERSSGCISERGRFTAALQSYGATLNWEKCCDTCDGDCRSFDFGTVNDASLTLTPASCERSLGHKILHIQPQHRGEPAGASSSPEKQSPACVKERSRFKATAETYGLSIDLLSCGDSGAQEAAEEAAEEAAKESMGFLLPKAAAEEAQAEGGTSTWLRVKEYASKRVRQAVGGHPADKERKE